MAHYIHKYKKQLFVYLSALAFGVGFIASVSSYAINCPNANEFAGICASDGCDNEICIAVPFTTGYCQDCLCQYCSEPPDTCPKTHNCEYGDDHFCETYLCCNSREACEVGEGDDCGTKCSKCEKKGPHPDIQSLENCQERCPCKAFRGNHVYDDSFRCMICDPWGSSNAGGGFTSVAKPTPSSDGEFIGVNERGQFTYTPDTDPSDSVITKKYEWRVSDKLEIESGDGTDTVMILAKELPSAGKKTDYVECKYFINDELEDTVTWPVTVVKVTLEEVTFDNNHTIVSDDGGTTYSSQHWKAGRTAQYPICFTKGPDNEMKISKAIWKIEPAGACSKDKSRVACTLSDNKTIAPKAPSSLSLGQMELQDATCSEAFDKLAYMENLSLTWAFSPDNEKTWINAGKSTNLTYVTNGKPSNSVQLFHTLVHAGCKAAKGESKSSEITESIYNVFRGRKMSTFEGKKELTYNTNPDDGTILRTVEELLREGRGNCEAWSALFRDMIRTQGIDAAQYSIKGPIDSIGLAVKQYTFGEPMVNPPYELFPYEEGQQAIPAGSIPAQRADAPGQKYAVHYITKVEGWYYDPSYGTVAQSSLKRYEDETFSGYFIFSNGKFYILKNDISDSSPAFVKETNYN